MPANSQEFNVIGRLVWPADRDVISSLNLIEMQVWYSSQEPRYMVYLGNNPEFKRFWKLNYLYPLKAKRFVYKLKRILINPFL